MANTRKATGIRAVKNDPEPTMFDLDALENEGADKPSFQFRHEGVEYAMSSPKDVGWQTLLASRSNPVLMFRSTMSEEDCDSFLAEDVPGWKIEALMDAYMKHYGLDPKAIGA